jgi:hypothetical protein
MPSRKSVRFEDLDDGAEDGVYGLKVRATQLWTRPFLTRVLRLLDQVFVSLSAPSSPCCGLRACATPTLTPPATTPIPSNHTQGMFNNLYAQATSYGKWARSHSKTVRDCQGWLVVSPFSSKLTFPSLPPALPHLSRLSRGV